MRTNGRQEDSGGKMITMVSTWRSKKESPALDTQSQVEKVSQQSTETQSEG